MQLTFSQREYIRLYNELAGLLISGVPQSDSRVLDIVAKGDELWNPMHDDHKLEIMGALTFAHLEAKMAEFANDYTEQDAGQTPSDELPAV